MVVASAYTQAAPSHRLSSRQDSTSTGSLQNINATYLVQHSFTNQTNSLNYKVNADFNTIIPSIHLDSHVSNIICNFSEHAVTASFGASAQSADITKLATSYGNQILLLVDGKWNCTESIPGKNTWVYATLVEQVDEKTIKFTNATLTKAAKYVESYSFVFNPVSSSLLARDGSVGQDLHFKIPPTTSSALTLAPGLTVQCSECGATADFNFKLQVTGTAKAPPKISMILTGTAGLSAGLQFNAAQTLPALTQKVRIPLAQLALTPLVVPGIISVGPNFGLFLDASVSAGVQGSFGFRADFTTGTGNLFEVNADATSTTIDGTSKFKPSLTLSPGKVANAGVKVQTTAAIFPEFNIGVEVLGNSINDFTAGVRFINDLTATITALVSTESTCNVPFVLQGSSRIQAFAGTASNDLVKFADGKIFSACISG
ncbi:hypothetical protein HK096_003829 [Nowakowskiella sp. JEL0078]|nr:hypothetical protein HK096_003829 [Nowakowskiella sp. JEL0078]